MLKQKPRRQPPRRCVLIISATGIHFTDRNAIEAIIARTKPTHHGLRSLVEEIVASELFQTR